MGMEFELTLPTSEVKIGQADGAFSPLQVKSPECCGWIQVSNLKTSGYKEDKFIADSKKVEVLKKLMSDKVFIPIGDWSKKHKKRTNFPLFCVLGDENQNHSTWPDVLEELGWIKGVPFYNPNTGNINTPYQWIPEECKV